MNDIVYVFIFQSYPLKKNRYRFSELKHARIARHGATGLLLDKLENEEKKRRTELLQKKKQEEARRAADSGLLKADDPAARIQTLTENSPYIEQKEEPKSHFRKIKKEKKKFSIWDYSELEYDELEKETAEKINQDGYYDEIVPLDEDFEKNDIKIGSKNMNTKILALIAVAILSLGASIYFVFSLF